jgi:hypothetical protein
MGDDPMALLGLEGALKHYYYYYCVQCDSGGGWYGVHLGGQQEELCR